MHVISIGSDREIFRENSPVRVRILDQAKFLKELHVIIFSLRFKNKDLNKIKIGENIWLYPTRSWSRFLYSRDAFFIVKSLIKNSKNDLSNLVITCQDPFESGQVGLWLKNYFKINLQIQVHTDFLNPYFLHTFFNRVRVYLARNVLYNADKIRVVSDRIKDSIVTKFKIPSEKIFVLPVFIDIQNIINSPITINLKKKYPQFDKIILMASRLTLEKNISLGIRSFARVKEIYPKAGLIIIGKGNQLNILKKEVKNLKLENFVIFEDWQNNLISYYKTADLFLLTSMYEGFGMTLIEAVVSGLPVVTSDVGIAGELSLKNDYCFVCKDNNEESFVKKMIFIFKNFQKKEFLKSEVEIFLKNILITNREFYIKKYIELLKI